MNVYDINNYRLDGRFPVAQQPQTGSDDMLGIMRETTEHRHPTWKIREYTTDHCRPH